jgi:hypothetical protein
MKAQIRPTRSAQAGTQVPASGTAFDWALAALSGWFVGGIWLDAWAHHNVPATLETPFTPWHGVLYTGFLAAAALLVGTAIRNRAMGSPWRRVMPAGYGLSLLGVLIFVAGGAGDTIWHLVFGIEVDLEAILSPTHLILALGGALIASGPLRAAWRRLPEGKQRETAGLPTLLSLALTVSVLTFFTEYASPFSLPWPARWFDASTLGAPEGANSVAAMALGQMLGVASILLQTVLLVGAVILLVRRWEPPLGAVTLVLTLEVGLAVLPHGYYLFVPGAVITGVASDALLRLSKPGQRAGALRIFAFGAPVMLFGLYFLALFLGGGIVWPIELWAGSVALSGAAGLLLSYLAVPPATGRRPAEL